MILVIDNYDSFVHNLARYFRQLGCETNVVRNDEINSQRVSELDPQAIVLSPGPCTPNEAGCCIDLVSRFGGSIPMLGICLGHQAIVQSLGGSIIRSNEPIHGRQSEVRHNGSAMFHDIPSPFLAGRYHSLIANRSDLPDCLNPTARTDDGTIMAVEHTDWPLIGLQFHPESILTDCGYQLIKNFLAIANLEIDSTALNDQPLGHWRVTDAPSQIKSSRLSTRGAR